MRTPGSSVDQPHTCLTGSRPRRSRELTIDGLTNLGEGVGRIKLSDDTGPWVVMVPAALPGERVRVRVRRNHKRHSQAELIEVLERSPHRVEPACPLFGECGGCQYMHLQYTEQLAWKTQQVRDLVSRIGQQGAASAQSASEQPASAHKLEETVRDAIGSPVRLGYRSKLTPHVSSRRDGLRPAIGFLHANGAPPRAAAVRSYSRRATAVPPPPFDCQWPSSRAAAAIEHV